MRHLIKRDKLPRFARLAEIFATKGRGKMLELTYYYRKLNTRTLHKKIKTLSWESFKNNLNALTDLGILQIIKDENKKYITFNLKNEAGLAVFNVLEQYYAYLKEKGIDLMDFHPM